MNSRHWQLLKQRLDARAAILEDISRISTLSREDRDAETLAGVNRTLGHAVRNSPFYGEKWRRGGLPDRVESLPDLADFPFTTKSDFRAAYPFGLLAVSRDRLVRYGESTGTTGSPTSAFMTQDDWDRDIYYAALSYLQFFTPRDLIFIAVPYELAFAAVATEMALWDIPVTMVAVGALNQVCPWSRTVRMMQELHPTVLMCTPTRALRLYDLCREEGVEPRAIGLRMIFCVGETCADAKLLKIARLWEVDLLNAYGTTETNSLSLPCLQGHQHLCEERFFLEVIAADGISPRLEEEAVGELVLTTLHAEALPLIRYRTGDLVKITESRCACGGTSRTIKHRGRISECFHLGDQEIPKIDLEEAILAAPGTGCYYAAEVAAAGLEVLVSVNGAERAGDVTDAVKESIYAHFGVPARVRVAQPEVFVRAMDRMLKPGSLSMGEVVRAMAASPPGG